MKDNQQIAQAIINAFDIEKNFEFDVQDIVSNENPVYLEVFLRTCRMFDECR